MSQDDTYVRAQLMKINQTIERVNETLNRMIEVISKIGDLETVVLGLQEKIDKVNERFDEFTVEIQKTVARKAAEEGVGPSKAAISDAISVLENLDSQIRSGMMAFDMSNRLQNAINTLERYIPPSHNLFIHMKRWIRILKSYGKTDPPSDQDFRKFKAEIRDWINTLDKERGA